MIERLAYMDKRTDLDKCSHQERGLCPECLKLLESLKEPQPEYDYDYCYFCYKECKKAPKGGFSDCCRGKDYDVSMRRMFSSVGSNKPEDRRLSMLYEQLIRPIYG